MVVTTTQLGLVGDDGVFAETDLLFEPVALTLCADAMKLGALVIHPR